MLFDVLKDLVLQEIKNTLGDAFSEKEHPIENPPELKLGDFAFPTFKFAKALKKAPPLIAKDLCEKLTANPQIQKYFDVEQAGPYVNFRVRKDVLLSQTLSSLLLTKNALAEKATSKRPKVVLEFSSPNVAKAFNIYHLRGTMIGNSLARIFTARGYDTVSINHLGDWGTQFGTLTLAFEKWGNEKELEENGIPYLVELYIRINKEIADKKESNETEFEALKSKARENFNRLENGDPALRKLWQKFVDLSLIEFKATYERLNVSFDHYWGESFYTDKIPALEKLLKDRSLLVESEGAQVVDLAAYNMPPCIVLKQDGSTIYATRDLAAAIYRYNQFHFEKMVYIVGGDQKLHFAQVFKVLDLAGLDWASKCVHIDFGLYRFGTAEEGFQKMSTRRGTFVTMDSVLDQAVEHVEKIIRSKEEQKMNEAEIKAAAETIGVSAIIFNDLSTDRNQDVNFSLERALDFDGETGPYILYAHTRSLSILRNAPENLRQKINVESLLDLSADQPGAQTLFESAQKLLGAPEETDLLRTLAKMPLILDQVLEHYKPSFLANYLVDVTKSFNVFYRAHKVLVEDENLARARLALVLATQRTLLKGLTLLGMRVPHRM